MFKQKSQLNNAKEIEKNGRTFFVKGNSVFLMDPDSHRLLVLYN